MMHKRDRERNKKAFVKTHIHFDERQKIKIEKKLSLYFFMNVHKH